MKRRTRITTSAWPRGPQSILACTRTAHHTQVTPPLYLLPRMLAPPTLDLARRGFEPLWPAGTSCTHRAEPLPPAPSHSMSASALPSGRRTSLV